jgi:SAM-dependent methyltransferase
MRGSEPILCKLCRGRLSGRRYALLGQGGIAFDAAECEICGLFQVIYDWKAREPPALTTEDDEALSDPLWGSEQELLAHESKAITFAQRLAEEGLVQGARVLDIGCGRGHFLRASRDLGAAAVTGQEFRRSDIIYARDALGLEDIRPIETKRTDAWPDDEFDVVCSFDVLEHVHDLKAFLEECLRVVRPGGHFFHATPGYDSTSHWLGRSLARYSPTKRTRHLAGILCNVQPEMIGQGGGHVSTIGIRSVRWFSNMYSLKIENMEYVNSYTYSNEHYAALLPLLRNLPRRIGASAFRAVRATIKNKLVFLAQVPL